MPNHSAKNQTPLQFADGRLISSALREGIALFNRGEFFECHEVLEDAWREEQGPLRDLYQGLIKVAVSFYHAQNLNYEGAIKVMTSGLTQLRPFRHWEGVQIDAFVKQSERCLDSFYKLEPVKSPLPPDLIPTIKLRP